MHWGDYLGYSACVGGREGGEKDATINTYQYYTYYKYYITYRQQSRGIETSQLPSKAVFTTKQCMAEEKQRKYKEIKR